MAPSMLPAAEERGSDGSTHACSPTASDSSGQPSVSEQRQKSAKRRATEALLQRREVQLQTFEPKDYLDKLKPSDADVQAYYQAHLHDAIFLQPTISYIPTPALSPTVPGALATTWRLTVLF